MKLQITLLLICGLYPSALSLKCYQCIPDTSGTCTNTQTVCPSQCGSVTTVVNVAGQQSAISAKDCASAAECVSGSLNLGTMKTTINTQCCSTDLCNSQNPPALPFKSPNGKRCYYCTDKDCSGIVDCLGDEDQCISLKVSAAGVQVTSKGCATRSICNAPTGSMQTAGISGDVSCCSGNLCNGAEGVKISLLFVLVPLLSSFLFL
ncbi:urokinase plasminogen activator surface receptor-like [Hoplias malabaricus]|uniref:urokinase plasminogen activator surface receptor-like n=1 Tax=Hoplias malabaricus TaxID=27720 RepID=UPI0034630892